MARRDATPRMGRPRRHGAADRARVAALLEQERGTQGRSAGEPALYAGLCRRGHVVSRRLLREELARMKALERREQRLRIEEQRQGVELLARDLVWGEDAFFLLRTGRKKLEGEVLRDGATTTTLSISAGAPARALDVIEQLERTARERGCYPLVLQSDNGPAYRSAAVAAHLARRRIVHLRSRTHTPTDNPATERGIGELRRESGVDGTSDDRTCVLDSIARAARVLNGGRLRASRGYRTAHELDATMQRAEDLVDRARFYEAACSRMHAAALAASTAREERKRQREALFDTLVAYGLARRRIGARCLAADPEPLTQNASTARMRT